MKTAPERGTIGSEMSSTAAPRPASPRAASLTAPRTSGCVSEPSTSSVMTPILIPFAPPASAAR
jgi:hypothetical protein